MARDAGFDAVEIHLGHNYLASAFLSPRLNRRRDGYGGPLAEPRPVRAGDRHAPCAPRSAAEIAILAKLNMDDGVRRGLRLGEAIQVARWLEQDGSLDALEMTAGSSLLNPMYLFKGPAPLREFAAAMREPVRTGVRLFGRTRLHSYPYRDAYLLDDARQVRAAVELPMVLLGGVTGRGVIGPGDARPASSSSRWPGRCCASPTSSTGCGPTPSAMSSCSHCNRCMPTIYSGTRCVEIPAQA